MRDDEFRRRAHALLSRMHLSRPGHRGEPRCAVCYDDPFKGEDGSLEGAELLRAGAASDAPIDTGQAALVQRLDHELAALGHPEHRKATDEILAAVRPYLPVACCPCCGGSGPPCPEGQPCCVQRNRAAFRR